MLIDITLKITPEILKSGEENNVMTKFGHIGTHFDVMDKEFPLEYTERKAVVFDVTDVKDRDIDIKDIDISKVEKDMFVAFNTGFIEKAKYGTKEYFINHPQLSQALIEELINRKVSIIGMDFAGIRRGKEHIPMDKKCADNGVFNIESLVNLADVVKEVKSGGTFIAQTFPMNYTNTTGLTCRVVAKIN